MYLFSKEEANGGRETTEGLCLYCLLVPSILDTGLNRNDSIKTIADALIY